MKPEPILPFGVPGTPLSEWQHSSALRSVTPIDLDVLIPPGRRLVVIAPHPDDEILACGGLLAAMNHRQQDVQLIAVTDGEGSHPHSTQWPPSRLISQRREESQRALAHLGLEVSRLDYRRLGIADGQVADSADALVHQLSQGLRADDILLTTWRHDGHCDHEATGHAAAQAAANTGATLLEMPVWAWHWAEPNDPRIPWDQARKFLLSDAQLLRKRQAISAHISQLQTDSSTGQPPVLSPATLERLLQPFELVFM
ncbi:PIG-L deacetylase family protein [Pseudomonas sp. NPDC087358]|uniref:PIG-L deacetylase family protein n=1 Tax=Pseudomonas sp. NPDC087358 TaxID=3364439 RepID=UPI00384C15CE